jgi:hypothetical protein
MVFDANLMLRHKRYVRYSAKTGAESCASEWGAIES